MCQFFDVQRWVDVGLAETLCEPNSAIITQSDRIERLTPWCKSGLVGLGNVPLFLRIVANMLWLQD